VKNLMTVRIVRWCVIVLLACAGAIAAPRETFAADTAAAPLRWAADDQGGAPYVFKDPAHPDQVIGFEVDLIDAIAAQLHRTPLFVQNQYDGLIAGLPRGDYDVVINGIEITDEHKDAVLFSIPY
jgi:polar amino acid transport system substrate-binding protein